MRGDGADAAFVRVIHPRPRCGGEKAAMPDPSFLAHGIAVELGTKPNASQ